MVHVKDLLLHTYGRVRQEAHLVEYAIGYGDNGGVEKGTVAARRTKKRRIEYAEV